MPTRDPFDTAYQVTDRNRKGSAEPRFCYETQNKLNQPCGSFPGALPVHSTSGFTPTIREQHPEKRRERVNMAAISPAFPTKPFKGKVR
jgi:hypothetical protein